MAAEDFAKLIIDKLESEIGRDGSKFNSNTPSKANKVIAEGITEYLIDNTKIDVSYVGVKPDSSPDPLTSDSCSITGECSPATGVDFDSWIKELESNIVSGFFISTGDKGVTPTSSPPAFIPGLSISRDDLKKIHENNLDDKNIQSLIWTKICEEIIKWLNSIVSASFAATNTNTSSTGTATPIKTIVK